MKFVYKESEQKNLKEASTLPAIAKVAGVANIMTITNVERENSVLETCKSMGLSSKINAMKNVVVEVSDMKTASAVLKTIYEQFGVKGSFMITWEGNGKVYFDPRTPVDKNVALAYANSVGILPPSQNPKIYIGY
ncbi:MAG: hypothetical protein ACRCZB_05435 [Bacteroidales bacterium]